MCCYSVMADQYKRIFFPPNPVVYPPPAIDRDTLDKLKEVLEHVRAIDEKLGIADCGPEKVEDLINNLERRVRELERKSKRKRGSHTLGMPE